MTRVVLATTAAEPGGVWRHVRDLAEGLAARGHHVTLALPATAPDLVAAAAELDLPVIGLRRSLRTGCDVWHLHAHKTFDPSLVGLLPARRAAGRGAVVLTEHLPRVAASDRTLQWDPTVPPGLRKPGARHAKTLLKRLEVASTQDVVTVSEASRAFLLARYGLRPDRVHAVPNGIAAPPVPPPPLPAGDRMRVVCVGALGWRKGYDVLIAAARLARRPWDAVVVGDGPLRSGLAEAARGLHGATVTFAGSRPDAADAAAEGHVACLPSRTESFPYAALEAMSRARPMVATAVDGVPELVRDGRTGLLVEPDDPAGLAAALDRLAADPAGREAMGYAGYALATGAYTVERMLDRTEEVYAAAVRRDR